MREAIAARYGLNAARIVCGAGSDELLQLIAHAYLGPGDEAVYSQHGFLVYPIAIEANGATAVVAPERDLHADVDAMLACVTAKTRIVFLANPNNPTGTYLPFDEVKRLHAGLPGDCLLVLDAAYAEYVRRNDYEAGIELVSQFDNVVMTRTFSKIHGLAALRLGWAYCPAHVADVLNRIRGPFNVRRPALAAGVGAIADRDIVEQAIAHNDTMAGLADAANSPRSGSRSRRASAISCSCISRRMRAQCAGGRCISDQPRHHPAAHGGLWPAGRACASPSAMRKPTAPSSPR